MTKATTLNSSTGRKNFTYGDIWESHIPEPTNKERIRVNPKDYTSNPSFLRFLEEVKYDIYLDYNMQNEIAFTDVDNKTIIINGNYRKEMIEPFLQHELGHLMLFDVNTFTTIKNNSLRSIIAKIIYTTDNLKTYGIERLFYIENVVQDIIIETVSGSACLCSNSLAFYKENMAVKHLDNLEDIKSIAKEVCKNLLKEEDINFPSGNHSQMEELLKSMINDLKEDTKEIEESIEEEKDTDKYKEKELGKIERERNKLESQIKKLKNKLEKLQEKGNKSTEKIEEMLEKLQHQLEQIRSPQTENEAVEKAEKAKEKTIQTLEKKLQHNKELLELLEQQLKEMQENMKKSYSNNDSNENKIADNQIHANRTDHLGDDTQADEITHTFDCGLPYPQRISRRDSHKRESNIGFISGVTKTKRTIINRESSYNVKGTGQKSPERELSYFKSNKKEFNETDMIKGKKVVRLSGINVLIGLDVSSSMSEEWKLKFNEISNLIENLQEKIDIKDIVYFTYNNHIAEYSNNINDLNLSPRGGNAFGYVYQEAMEKLPIRTKNEIILVTDCGDNLGFKLNNVCETNLDNEKVTNHISIIDTEPTVFYAKQEFDNTDWSLYTSTDKNLHDKIKTNIENLIDR